MSGQAKPGSKPYRTQLRARLAALGFAQDAIRDRVVQDLIAECGIAPRTAWRLTCELTLDAAAARYNASTGDPRAAMRGSRIWEYEQWPDRGVRPTVAALRVLAEVYGTTWQSLLSLRDLEHLPPNDLAEYRAGTSTSPVANTDVAADALAEASLLTTTNVDDVQLDDLWSDIAYLSNAYTRTPADSVLREVSLVQQRVATLLRGRQRPKQTSELYLVNAKCCAMMAWICGDLGKHGLARRLSATAWLYAQYVDDHAARRWARTAQARMAYWAGNAVESAQLAADARRYRIGRPGTDSPFILAEARGWSSVQAESQVLDAIDRWARIEETLPESSDDRFFSFFDISKDRRHYMAGSSLLAVGQPVRALREFDTARQAYAALDVDQQWAAMAPMIRIDTGRAHLSLGDLDAAAAELAPLLSTDLRRQPDMVRAMLNLLTRDLSDPRWHGVDTAADLVDALRFATSAG